jgi:serine/threonine protein kinase
MNIMKNMGSLQNGLTYSLFMPLAECDLQQYMMRNPDAPHSNEAKASMLLSAAGLADAIRYLHKSLRTTDLEELSCFHMDLKPQNILIVKDPDGTTWWKLSDFNMSRVKRIRKPSPDGFTMRRRPTISEQVYNINNLFKRAERDHSDSSGSSITPPPRGFGTYVAPEFCVGDDVGAESDTWSLGCVICVLFSYLHRGNAGVVDFCNQRAEQGHDSFFTFTNPGTRYRLSNARINGAVLSWLQDLRLQTARQNSDEGVIFDTVLEFVRQKVLIIDPSVRQETTAEDISDQLKKAQKNYHVIDSRTDLSPKVPGPRQGFSEKWKLKLRPKSTTRISQSDWSLPLPLGDWRKCVFGPAGDPLVYVTTSSIVVYSLDHVLLSGNNNDLIERGTVRPATEGRLWSDSVAASERLVIAATNHKWFDVSIDV